MEEINIMKILDMTDSSSDDYGYIDPMYEGKIGFMQYCNSRYKEIINNTPPEFREYHDAKYLVLQFDYEYHEFIVEEYSNNFSDNIENPNS